MLNQVTHPSIKQPTVKPIDGGWVSYVDPHEYPKAHFGETKPYYAPNDVSTLQGPDAGLIKLPLDIYWGPDRWFNLIRRSTLHEAYRTILQEADIEEINLYINRDVLQSIWSELDLPARLTCLWEDNVKGFKHV